MLNDFKTQYFKLISLLKMKFRVFFLIKRQFHKLIMLKIGHKFGNKIGHPRK